METIKITNERLNIFVVAGKQYCNTTPRSKLWFAVDKITKIAEKLLKKVEKQREEKRREFAVKKEKGIYDLTATGGWQFDEAGHKSLVAAMEEIDSKEVELKVHIVADGDFDESVLFFDMRENFEGIVIPQIDYDTFDVDKYLEELNKKKELAGANHE